LEETNEKQEKAKGKPEEVLLWAGNGFAEQPWLF
jgi:hypothetical protein